MSGPTETPLVDLLRIVPIDAVGKWDTGPFATSSTPYGSLCHRAADEIERLRVIALAAAAPAGEPAIRGALEACLPFIDDAADVHGLFPDSAASAECRKVVEVARAAIASSPRRKRILERDAQEPPPPANREGPRDGAAAPAGEPGAALAEPWTPPPLPQSAGEP